MVAAELGEECKSLINRGILLLVDFLMASEKLAKYMFELGGVAYNRGRKDGYAEGKVVALERKANNYFELFKEDCAGHYRNKLKEFGVLEFGVLKAIEKLSRKGVVVDVLCTVLEGGDVGAGATGGDTGTSGSRR
ncbi:hypothetical protein Hdeb2414_s0001g00021691 [Helianthus debilis subsp. tardiflorus]